MKMLRRIAEICDMEPIDVIVVGWFFTAAAAYIVFGGTFNGYLVEWLR